MDDWDLGSEPMGLEPEAGMAAMDSDPGKDSGKVAQVQAKAKAKGKKAVVELICFAYSCEDKAKNKNIWCPKHARLAAQWILQATTPDEIKSANEVMGNPLKAELALDELEKAKGDKSRYPAINWIMVKKMFILSVKITVRDRDVLMDMHDFVAYRSPRVGAAVAKEEWTKIKLDPRGQGYEYEGEGDLLAVWVAVARERMRDRVKEIAHMMEVASRQIKPRGNEEGVVASLTAAIENKGDGISFADCFFDTSKAKKREGMSLPATPGTPSSSSVHGSSKSDLEGVGVCLESPFKKRIRVIDLSEETAKMFTKWKDKELPKILVDASKTLLVLNKTTQLLSVDYISGSGDIILDRYVDTFMVRKQIFNLWLGDEQRLRMEA